MIFPQLPLDKLAHLFYNLFYTAKVEDSFAVCLFKQGKGETCGRKPSGHDLSCPYGGEDATPSAPTGHLPQILRFGGGSATLVSHRVQEEHLMKRIWKRQWVKLWIELLDDTKMGKLPDWLWRRAIELFLLAGENENDGLLQPVTDLAWRLRTSEKRLTESLAALSIVGVVHETPEGWCVTNFKKRQWSESLERVKRYRNGYSNGACNGDAAADVSSSASESLSSVLEEDRGVGEGETTANVFATYESNIGLLTPMISEALKEAEQTFSAEWVTAAIEEAVRSNARSWNYCEAILNRWRREGFKAPKATRTGGWGKQSPEERQAQAMENIRKGMEMAFGGEDA